MESTRALKPAARVQRAVAVRSDHAGFHRAVLQATAGGALGALGAHFVAAAMGASLTESPIFFTVAVATGALAMVAAQGRRWWRILTGGALGAGGGALFTLAMPWPAFAAALLGSSAVPVLAPKAHWRSKLATGVLASLTAAAGLFVGQVFLGWDPLGGWLPGPLTSGAAGAATGLFFGLAAAPRHLAPPRDPIEQALRAALAHRDGEIHAILERTLRIHQALQAELHQRDNDPSVRTLGEQSGQAVMRILEIAGQCRRVDDDLAATPIYQLDERIVELDQKVATARDPAAQQTYRDAVSSLRAQKDAVDRISLGRERIVARLHANVAILEKLRFSLIHLRNAQTERIGGEASPVVEALEELGRELDATATAVGEVFSGTDQLALPADAEANDTRYAYVRNPVSDDR